ncbi:MAG: hypothetical protein IKD31_01870 [Clostridia bacterium]|nr:hypothetical protein [Clostridia bacterium]
MRLSFAALKKSPFAAYGVYPLILAVTLILFLTAPLTENGTPWLYGGLFSLLLFALRPSSLLHRAVAADPSVWKNLFSAAVAILTALVCILPMDNLSLWNGEIPGHRNQYELMAEAILDGRIDFAYGDEEELAELENPYDPEERQKEKVSYHWDHAYYNGHYYMYFGIVPVFLVFLPYRILTGEALTTFHATQIFVALAIAGIFVLFHLLCRLFFRKMPYSVYLLLSVSLSVMSVWYSSAEPALYCTAITSAIAVEIWSLFFFVWAVWGEKRENLQLLLAGIGALLGALAFGCRPPIALANVLVLPMLWAFCKGRRFTLRLLGKLFLAALPYFVIGGLLMSYNAARFDSPFEFGQAYQLTVADQSQYRVTLDLETLLRLTNGSLEHFFAIGSVSETFPYLYAAGAFYNFPILLLGAALFLPSVQGCLKKHRLLPLALSLIATVLLITALDIMWSPYLLERYHMDIYFLMGISLFLAVGGLYESSEKSAGLSFAASALSCVTVVSSFLFCFDQIGAYYPEVVQAMGETLHLIP